MQSILAFLVLASSSAIATPVTNLAPRASVSSPLFPVSPQLKYWTTDPSLSGAKSLSDSTLRPQHEASGLTHDVVTAPDNERSIRAFYPKGSTSLSNSPRGGFSFYAPGPSNVDLTTAKEATLSYSVYFPLGFDFVKGGKLPGFYGGDSDDEAYGCSGGSRDTACFSMRFMWRRNGDGELYSYLPPNAPENKKVCNVPPYSECNDVYGASSGRGAFRFPRGSRATIGQRVLLNDAGKANGEVEVYVNGRSVFVIKGLMIRNASAGRIRGIMMQTFFGGSDSTWASPTDQSVYFNDFSVAITKNL